MPWIKVWPQFVWSTKEDFRDSKVSELIEGDWAEAERIVSFSFWLKPGLELTFLHLKVEAI